MDSTKATEYVRGCWALGFAQILNILVGNLTKMYFIYQRVEVLGDWECKLLEPSLGHEMQLDGMCYV